MELFPNDLSLPGFLDSIAGIIRMLAQQENVQFEFEADADLPGYIHADETKLRQILINGRIHDLGEIIFMSTP